MCPVMSVDNDDDDNNDDDNEDDLPYSDNKRLLLCQWMAYWSVFQQDVNRHPHVLQRDTSTEMLPEIFESVSDRVIAS